MVAVKRRRRPFLLEAAIELVGLRELLGVDDDDRVDRRAPLVVRLDPPQVLFDEGAAGQAPGSQRRADVGDGGLVRLEG
jgi:hypothetical protein